MIYIENECLLNNQEWKTMIGNKLRSLLSKNDFRDEIDLDFIEYCQDDSHLKYVSSYKYYLDGEFAANIVITNEDKEDNVIFKKKFSLYTEDGDLFIHDIDKSLYHPADKTEIEMVKNDSNLKNDIADICDNLEIKDYYQDELSQYDKYSENSKISNIFVREPKIDNINVFANYVYFIEVEYNQKTYRFPIFNDRIAIDDIPVNQKVINYRKKNISIIKILEKGLNPTVIIDVVFLALIFSFSLFGKKIIEFNSLTNLQFTISFPFTIIDMLVAALIVMLTVFLKGKFSEFTVMKYSGVHLMLLLKKQRRFCLLWIIIYFIIAIIALVLVSFQIYNLVLVLIDFFRL